MSNSNTVLVITGPTASGKSSLAVECALHLNGEVISADSMQVYRGFDIATAKITPEEMKGVPHHLIDIRDPLESFTVADFVKECNECIREIHERSHTAIVCGGTLQYITALIRGIEFPEGCSSPKLRAKLWQEVSEDGNDIWHKQLQELDPEAAERINVNDTKRIVRFFEVYQCSGLTQSEVNRRSLLKGTEFNFCTLGLYPERSLLYESINVRCQKMFDEGIIDELKGLLDRYPELRDAQSFQAIGYKELLPYLEGNITQDEALEKLARNSRRYAKRQLSWMRSMEEVIFIKNPTFVGKFEEILGFFT